MDPALRTKLEAAIDHLVDVLDAIDAVDEDLEPQGDEEPALGSSEYHPGQYGGSGNQGAWSSGDTSDREQECEDEGAQCDDEGARDSGIADSDGLLEQIPGCHGGFGSSGFAKRVE